MAHSHPKPTGKAKDKISRGEDGLKEKVLHAHDESIPDKEEIGDKPHQHNEHQGHKEHDRHERHGDHHRMMIQDFKRSFWASVILSVLVIVFSPSVKALRVYSFYNGKSIL